MKTAIVTGSSRGIGKAIALRLAKDGFNVVVNYLKNKTEAEDVVQEIKATNGAAIAVQADVSKIEEVKYLFITTEKEFGGIDVLVNNAAISKIQPLIEGNDETFDLLFNTNVRGTMNTMRGAAKHLNEGGRVINFSSTAVATSTPNMGLYIATKAAVEGMTKVFAKELRGKNITVNAIAPGLIESEMFFEGKTDAQIEQMSKLSPLERLGDVSEIANVVSFLASEEASWINGQILKVNGGAM
jgi:3-oxoacyl-[acyl-carrier protein] reductase